MKLSLTYEDGNTESLKVKPKHIAAFESAGYSMVTDGTHVSWLYRLAWFAKDQPGAFEGWLEHLDDVSSGEDEVVEPGPTTPGSPA
jgi:hypothetical protein